MAPKIGYLLAVLCLGALTTAQSDEDFYGLEMLKTLNDQVQPHVDMVSGVDDLIANPQNDDLEEDMKNITDRVDKLEGLSKTGTKMLQSLMDRIAALESKDKMSEKSFLGEPATEVRSGSERKANPKQPISKAVGLPQPEVRQISMPEVKTSDTSDKTEKKVIGKAMAKPRAKPEVKSSDLSDKPEMKVISKAMLKSSVKPEVKSSSKPEMKPKQKPEVKPADTNCGTPPAREDATVTMVTTDSGPKAVYACKDGFVNIGRKTLSSSCGWNKLWSYVDIACSNLTTCFTMIGKRAAYIGRAAYNGKINVTKSGKTCQRWDSQSPNIHFYGGDYCYGTTRGVGPETVHEAASYCRDPGKKWSMKKLWCFTVDPKVRWEECDVPKCHIPV